MHGDRPHRNDRLSRTRAGNSVAAFPETGRLPRRFMPVVQFWIRSNLFEAAGGAAERIGREIGCTRRQTQNEIERRRLPVLQVTRQMGNSLRPEPVRAAARNDVRSGAHSLRRTQTSGVRYVRRTRDPRAPGTVAETPLHCTERVPGQSAAARAAVTPGGSNLTGKAGA